MSESARVVIIRELKTADSIFHYITLTITGEAWEDAGEFSCVGNPLLRSSTARVRWSRLLLSTVSSICSFALLMREFILRCWRTTFDAKWVCMNGAIKRSSLPELTFASTRSLNSMTRACNLASSFSMSCLDACLDLFALPVPSNECCLRFENTSTGEQNAGSMPPKS